ncbi:MAG TPA: hypothetical protein VMQ51_00270 [Candidatus Binatia bacterium]|nr:hypothetical protein [Candidatus Binatia bacterium]
MALAVGLGLGAVATAVLADRIAPLSYVARHRTTALGWAVILPALVLLAGPVLACLGARSGAPVWTLRQRWTMALLAGSALFASALLPRSPAGDEPAYLAMAASLASHGTLDVAGADESLHRSAASRPGENRSIHDPGMSALLAVPWLVLGLAGARVAGVLLAVALIAVTRRLLAETLAPDIADPLSLVLAVSFPVAAYAALLFPEVAGALALAILFAELVAGASPTIIGAIAATALPWLHVRFLAPAALLAVWGLKRRATRARAATRVVLPLAVSLVARSLLHQRWFGSPSPLAAWEGRDSLLSLDAIIPGTLGILVDQQAGLLLWGPLFLFAPMGAWALWQRRPDVVVGALALTATVASPGILHQWWAGWSPAARFLVAATAPLALLFGAGLAAARADARLGWHLVRAVVVAQLAIGAFCLAVPRRLFGTVEVAPRNYVLDLVGRVAGIDTAWLAPTLIARPGAASTIHAALLVALWLAGSWLLVRRLRRIAGARWIRP